MSRLIILVVCLAAAAVPASAQEPPPSGPRLSQTPIRLVISASMIAHGADLSTTAWAFGRAGDRYVESNPVLRPFAGDPVALAVAKMSMAVGVNYGLLRLYQHRPKTAIVAGVLQTVATAYVAHRNAQLLGLRGQ